MGKIKSLFKMRSIKTSLFWYTAVCVITTLLLMLIIARQFQAGQDYIYNKYREVIEDTLNSAEFIYVENVSGLLVNFKLNYYFVEDFSDIDGFLYLFCIYMQFFTPVIIAITGTVTLCIVFYKFKLKKPLQILQAASERISANDLDFTVFYKSENEFGNLARSFDKMRQTLKENNIEMWRQMDERKRLNAAFSHDLRTPLTVLKGYNDMMLKYVPDESMSRENIVKTAQIMSNHIARLENYVDEMNRLQKLEDIEINRIETDTDEFITELKNIGEIVKGEKSFELISEHPMPEKVNIDSKIVTQVYENIIANAARFAQTKITASISYSPEFSITVTDDGKGFSKTDLENVTKPFYKSISSTNSTHLGMGLNICKILCEKHGGKITVSNDIQGGGKVTVSFK